MNVHFENDAGLQESSKFKDNGLHLYQNNYPTGKLPPSNCSGLGLGLRLGKVVGFKSGGNCPKT